MKGKKRRTIVAIVYSSHRPLFLRLSRIDYCNAIADVCSGTVKKSDLRRACSPSVDRESGSPSPPDGNGTSSRSEVVAERCIDTTPLEHPPAAPPPTPVA